MFIDSRKIVGVLGKEPTV